MKRILAVLMGTAMVLSLAACSQETAKTPEEIYDEALVKSMSLDALGWRYGDRHGHGYGRHDSGHEDVC